MVVAINVLVIAEAERAARSFVDSLAQGDYAPNWLRVGSEAQLQSTLAERSWDVAVCVVEAGRAPGALRALRARITDVDIPLVLFADDFEDVAEAAQRLGASVCLRHRGYAHVGPALDRALRERDQRRERAARAAFDAGQQRVLEHVAEGHRLAQVLEEIVLLVEEQGEGMLCSILLLDRDAGRVRHGAAPHLPRALVEGVDGAAIGPNEGSCGAAAYLGKSIVVEDIGTHPNWVAYRQLALADGLRACWSTPILSATERHVLGTFAMYYRRTRGPSDRERAWVARATHLAAIAIERDLAERTIRQAEMRYRQIVDTAYEGIWLIDGEARTLFVNRRATDLMGYTAAELLGRPMVDFMDGASRRVAQGTFLQRLRHADEQHEFRFQRKDGAFFWALVSGSPIRDDLGRVVGALGMVTDISDLKRTEEALRRSEAEFRAVFEHAATGFAHLRDDGSILRVNPAFERFIGYSGVELRSMKLSELMHPDDRKQTQGFQSALRRPGQDGFSSERRYVRRNGEIVWGRMVASFAKAAAGVDSSIIVLIENVTERRQLEEAVRSSERLRMLMYSAVADILFYLEVLPDDEYRFASVNPAFARATGLREQDIIGRSVRDVIPAPSLDMVLANYARAIRERRTVSWEEVTVYPAGKKYGEVSITPIFDPSGMCTNLAGTVHDVTERRMAEERVAAQAALLDKANDAILVRDLDGRVEYWNQGAERLYGWTKDEALGRDVASLIYRDRAALDRAQRAVLANDTWSGELPQCTKHGEELVVVGSWTLIRDDKGCAVSTLVINTDVTEKKSLEMQVFHTQRLQSMGLLAGGIAHDFNNLLTVIFGNVEVMRLGLDPDQPATRSLAEIEKASGRAAALVRQLLTFSRRQESRRQPSALSALAFDALGLLRSTIPKQIHVETDSDPDTPTIFADTTQVHQIVMNLVTNAVHAMGAAPGTLRLVIDRQVLSERLPAHAAALAPGVYARLVVEDNGTGMSAATLDRIFDPFFTTKGANEGTGLGLSVVNGIVRNHGGAIVVESRPGVGTRFSLYFPEYRDRPAGDVAPSDPAASTDAVADPRTPLRSAI